MGNSVYLAIGIALTKLLYYGKLSSVWKFIQGNYPSKLIIWTIWLILLSITFTVINGEFEFSRTVALVSLLIGLLSAFIIYSSLNHNNQNSTQKVQMEKMIVYVFVMQSIISIISFVSPTFRVIISHFQFSEDANLAEDSYSGIRGLALSGRLYYEFAASCGLIVLFQIYRITESGRITYAAIGILLLLIVCGFFAGRTSLVGLGAGIFYVLFSKNRVKFKTEFILRFILTIGLFGILIWLLIPLQIRDFIIEHLFPWVFDVFIKYFETGSTESSASFNALNEMYQNVQISEHEWIVGSGIYTEPSGRYYGHVDAGYLRQILYWGILGTIISLIYTTKIFQLPWKVSRNNINQHLFILTILIYTLIVHYKGDLLSISRFYYVILYLYFTSIWQTYIRNYCIHTEYHSY